MKKKKRKLISYNQVKCSPRALPGFITKVNIMSDKTSLISNVYAYQDILAVCTDCYL